MLAFQSDLKNHIESINSARSEIKEIPEKITDISKNLENLETSQSEFSHVFETGFEELLGSVRSLNEKLDGVFSDLTEMESRQRLGETLKKDENCFSNLFIIISFFSSFERKYEVEVLVDAQIGIDQARKNILAGITTPPPTAPVRHGVQILKTFFRLGLTKTKQNWQNWK